MKQKFEYLGETPAHGKIYVKGKTQLVIYTNGIRRLWPDFHGNHDLLLERNRRGRVSKKNPLYY